MSKATTSPDQVLDCSGLSCPIPVIKTSKAIKQIEVGQILKVISTDSGTEPDMEAWSIHTGHELLGTQMKNGLYIYFFRRTI